MTKNGLRLGPCEIHETATIGHGAILGKPFRPLLDGRTEGAQPAVTVVGEGVHVGPFSTVGSGSILEPGVIVDDYCTIECDVRIGPRSLMIYRSQVCNEAIVGQDCVIGGFIAEGVVIGDRSRVFGKVVHSQHDPSTGWDTPSSAEPSATIGPDAFVGFSALVIGGVKISPGAYVCAGAIVTKDVSPGHVAYGVNRIVPADQWHGPLRRSPFFAAASQAREDLRHGGP